tara:strand:+ start:1027 stop:1413 length:387 start_codon:yes stop_codon:yes gene_type:complete
MIDHLGITVSNIESSTAFYVKTLGAIGYVLRKDSTNTVSFGVRQGHGKSTDPGGDFWLSHGRPMIPRTHIAFGAESRVAVDAFFAAGVAAGGIEHGKPKLRPRYHPDYYAAYLLDPDGYNIEAVCHAK